MAILKEYKTIPELFTFLTTEFGKDMERPLLKYKVKDQWLGITYSKFKEETISFARGLATLGIKRGDRVAIISENRPEWAYSDMAILGIGAIDVPLYPSLTADHVEFILNNCEASTVILSTKFQLNKVLKIRANCKSLKHIIVLSEKDVPENSQGIYSFSGIQNNGLRSSQFTEKNFWDSVKLSNENELCTIIYTSGTTGEPKGVMLTHKNIICNIMDALRIFPIGKDDVFLSFLPLCHIFERMTGYYTAFSAGSLVCYAQSIETVAQDMIELKPTLITTVPRLFERIQTKILRNVESQSPKKQKIFNWALETGAEFAKAKKSGLPSISLSLKHALADKLVFKKLRERTGGRIRFFISGGAALPRELGEFFEAIGFIVAEGYGMTESAPVISVNRVDDYKFGTVGKPMPSVEVKIASDGEILVRGANVMQGYYKNKKETDETIKDGWLHTGDIGMFDAQGYLVITDRKKHLFKTSGGKYIAPTPIESLFLSSQYIDQFVLIGDRRMFLSALIVPDFDALRAYADSNNIPYKTNEDLVEIKEIYDLMETELVKFQKSLANYERVRKFALLDKPFSLESGEMTPTLKLKRKVIEERYKELIEGMYIDMNK